MREFYLKNYTIFDCNIKFYQFFLKIRIDFDNLSCWRLKNLINKIKFNKKLTSLTQKKIL